jgi:hypothetical protein
MPQYVSANNLNDGFKLKPNESRDILSKVMKFIDEQNSSGNLQDPIENGGKIVLL